MGGISADFEEDKLADFLKELMVKLEDAIAANKENDGIHKNGTSLEGEFCEIFGNSPEGSYLNVLSKTIFLYYKKDQITGVNMIPVILCQILAVF